MTRADKTLALLVVALLGVWGCAQGPSGQSASAEKIRSLESRVVKLEDDFRAAASARDQLRRKLALAEDDRQQLLKERDDLRNQVVTRLTERDRLQTQYDQFRKNIRELLGQAEAAAPASGATTTTVAAGPTTGQP